MTEPRRGRVSTNITLNQFEIKVSALAPASGRMRSSMPSQPMASKGSDAALNEAIDAVHEVLRRHGFEIARTGYGVHGLANFEDVVEHD